MNITPAVPALAAYLEGGAHSQSSLAKALDVSQPSVSAWLCGRARPEPHLREAIEIVTGIPQSLWTTDEERAAVERIRAREIDANEVADHASTVAA